MEIKIDTRALKMIDTILGINGFYTRQNEMGRGAGVEAAIRWLQKTLDTEKHPIEKLDLEYTSISVDPEVLKVLDDLVSPQAKSKLLFLAIRGWYSEVMGNAVKSDDGMFSIIIPKKKTVSQREMTEDKLEELKTKVII